jgi:hypothetical protein
MPASLLMLKWIKAIIPKVSLIRILQTSITLKVFTTPKAFITPKVFITLKIFVNLKSAFKKIHQSTRRA